MKSSGAVAFFSLFLLACVGCGGADDGLDEETGEEETVATDEEGLTAVPVCQDLVLHQIWDKFCGPQTGPLDDSPVFVRCERTCVTERHMVLNSPTPGGGGFVCESDGTECTPWECPSCEDY